MNTVQRPPPGPLSVSEPWDIVSEGYAAEAEPIMLPFTRDAIALCRPARQAHVLDVAAGSGVLALEVAPRVQRVDAIDFSPRMLEQLEIRRRARGVGNVFAQLGDGQALPFEDASFDAAFSMFGLMFFPDRARGFAELLRVLRPGAAAVVSSWAPLDRSPLMLLMIEALRRVDPTRPAPQTNLLSLENPDLFCSEMLGAGFEDVAVGAYEHTVLVDSAESYWRAISRSAAPITLLKKRLGPEEWERQGALALEYLQSQIQGHVELATTAFLAIGRRPVHA